MPSINIEDIFQAQTQNVCELNRAWIQINRNINSSYMERNNVLAKTLTKNLVILYCALTEAVLSKHIHTPHGLSSTEITQIKSVTQSNGLLEGWKKTIQLALMKVRGENSGHRQNVQRRMNTFIDQYLLDTRLIRNKIAHGQWCIALNRENTAINQDLTQRISRINVVQLHKHKEAFMAVAQITEDIIESPIKTHPRDYWTHIAEIERQQERMSSWTIEEKVQKLQLRRDKSRAYTQNLNKT